METTQHSDHYLNHLLNTLLRLCLILLVIILIVTVGRLTLPFLMPNLTAVLIRADSTLFWYLSRASAIVGFILLWLSTIMGLLITTRLGKTWPGMKASNESHQYVSLLGLFFTGFHGVTLLGDTFIKTTFSQLLIPFTFFNYRPVFVGIGQLAFYVWILVLLSFYVRKVIGRKVWRGLHYLGFAAFFAGMVHGITSGSDSTMPWMQFIYWLSAASVLFLTIFRILMYTSTVKQVSVVQKT